MICPNCGSNMSDKRKRCERCGTDLTIYKKINRASNLYYNDGLARARVRDLSGAIVALRNSLNLNKSNTNARNLLGLIYYEMGETVAALSEWVISRHFQPQNNDAEEYINKVQSNPTKLDSLNQAIKRYNTALGYAKQGSDDLAIIQLKKVVTLNPNFIRAYHLLALLLMKTGDTDKARRNLAKAAKIDVSNTTTLRYMQELEAPAVITKDLDSNPEAEQITTSSIRPISSYKEDKPNIMAFVNLVIGVIIGLAVFAFLILPTYKKNIIADKNSEYVDYGAEIAQLEQKKTRISELESENTQLNKDIEQLRTQIESFEVPEDKTAVYEPLLNATQLFLTELDKPESQRDYTAIADLLTTVEDDKLEIEASVSLLRHLREVTYPSAAKAHYDIGHDDFYSKGKYDQALAELAKAMILDPQDDDAVYFTARSYDRLGDKENAAIYYKKVLDDFPDSKRKGDAENFLAHLK